MPHAARPCIDQRADVVEQAGNILDFIEDNERTQFFGKSARIGSHALLDVGILQQNIAGLGERPAAQRGLTGAVWAGDDDGGLLTGGFFEEMRQFFGAREALSNLRLYLKKLNSG